MIPGERTGAPPRPAAVRAACYVWWAGTEDATPDLVRVLSAGERERLVRHRRPEDRARSLVGAALARVLLARELACSPQDVPLDRTCPRCGEQHGKPRLRGAGDLELSIAHAAADVGVVVTRGAPVGLDVDRADGRGPRPDAALLPLVLSPTELSRWPAAAGWPELLRVWVRKEAVGKALGHGLALAPESFSVMSTSGPAPVVTGVDDEVHAGPVTLLDLPDRRGALAALAVLGSTVSVVEHDARPLLAR